ncbi:MAG: hypothetical protein AAB677_00795 [Patescibacteria group bacterium]
MPRLDLLKLNEAGEVSGVLRRRWQSHVLESFSEDPLIAVSKRVGFAFGCMMSSVFIFCSWLLAVSLIPNVEPVKEVSGKIILFLLVFSTVLTLFLLLLAAWLYSTRDRTGFVEDLEEFSSTTGETLYVIARMGLRELEELAHRTLYLKALAVMEMAEAKKQHEKPPNDTVDNVPWEVLDQKWRELLKEFKKTHYLLHHRFGLVSEEDPEAPLFFDQNPLAKKAEAVVPR